VENDSLSIVLTNDLSDLPPAVERAEAFCHARNISAQTIHRFTLALEEALTNVITYAFSDGLRHEIEVRIELRDGALTATVSDDGHPFDPLSHPPPDVDAPLEDRTIGGLGIHLIRSMMDAVGYRRVDGRNHLTFRTHVDASKPT
jgi:serine/threonine-protein kinase RsbW